MDRTPQHSARFVGAAALLALAACARHSGPVEIGFASNRAGPGTALVAQQALDASRRPGDPLIRILVPAGDTAGSPLMREVDRALRFRSDPRIAAVVGPGGSREALQTAPVYRDAGIPNLIPTATTSRLRDAGAWTFLLASNDSVQGEFIGAFAAERLHARRALLFYLPDEYGLGLASGTAAALGRRGIMVIDRVVIPARATCAAGAPNPYAEPAAAGLGAGPPDVVIFAARTLESACTAAYIHARLPGVPFIAGDGTMPEPDLFRIAGTAATAFYLVAFWTPERDDPASRDFVARFRSAAGRNPEDEDAMYYDALMIAAEAVRAVGSDRARIRRYLEELGAARPAYRGVTGMVAFRPGSPRPLLMTRIQGDGAVVVPPQ